MVYVSAHYSQAVVGLTSEGLSQGVLQPGEAASQLSTQMMTSASTGHRVESVRSPPVSSYRCPVRPGPSPGEEQLNWSSRSPSH